MASVEAEEGEDPRWRRSNTDCVYFLASRFTCTKGSKCEYRHSEGARVNRKNCWYWFHGNCVNPSCTFRHPPLESFNRTKSSADPLSSYDSNSVKTGNPCYFYYNSYCTKGDHCPFLHEPLCSTGVVGISSEATPFNPAVNENSAGDGMIEASEDALANPCQDTSDDIKKRNSKEVPESSNPEFDGPISNAPEMSTDTDECMKSSMLSDQSSGDAAMEHTEQDEWYDSSPGFDVLVDDELSNKNDLEHQLGEESDAKVLHVKYDFGDPVGYDVDYHDSECYEQEFCRFDDQYGYVYSDHFEGVQEYDSETTLGHISCHRRKLVKSTSDGFDIRFLHLPRNFSSVADIGFVNQHSQIRHISERKPENRKGAKGRKGRMKRCRGLERRNGSQEIESRLTHHRQDSMMGGCSQPAVYATFSGQKKKSRGKQHRVLSARASRHPTAKKRPPDGPEDFTGPKTLAQIKEEKCRSKSSFSHPAAHMLRGRSFLDDFEGPKSLSELLEAKGRTTIGKEIILQQVHM